MNKPAMLCAALILLGGVSGCGGGGAEMKTTTSSGAEGAKAIAQALASYRGELRSPFIVGNETHCSYAGPHAGHASATYSCSWLSEGDQFNSTWEMYEGSPARISDGGEGDQPPSDNAAASSLVSGTLHAGASARCERALARNNSATGQEETENPHTYECALVDANGEPVAFRGEPIHEKWQWHADGSVAEDIIDIIPLSDYKLESATTSTQAETTPSTPAAEAPRAGSMLVGTIDSAHEDAQARDNRNGVFLGFPPDPNHEPKPTKLRILFYTFIINLRWSGWGGQVATGVGQLEQQCPPEWQGECGGPDFVAGPAKVLLSKPVSGKCGIGGEQPIPVTFYTQLTLQVPPERLRLEGLGQARSGTTTLLATCSEPSE